MVPHQDLTQHQVCYQHDHDLYEYDNIILTYRHILFELHNVIHQLHHYILLFLYNFHLHLHFLHYILHLNLMLLHHYNYLRHVHRPYLRQIKFFKVGIFQRTFSSNHFRRPTLMTRSILHPRNRGLNLTLSYRNHFTLFSRPPRSSIFSRHSYQHMSISIQPFYRGTGEHVQPPTSPLIRISRRRPAFSFPSISRHRPYRLTSLGRFSYNARECSPLSLP